MTKFEIGSNVRWKWGAHIAHGKIVERFERKVTGTIKGEKITRNGSKETPAYLIKQAEGDTVLKSTSELEPER